MKLILNFLKKIIFFILFGTILYFGVQFTDFIIKNGQVVWGISEEELVGEYIFEYKDTKYILYLKNNRHLEIYKYHKNNSIMIDQGIWKLKFVGITAFLDEKFLNTNNLELSLGMIQVNLFTKKIKIEVLSLGNIYGEETNTYFIKL